MRAWNARRVAFILDKEIREEYKTPTFDLVARIRARRLKWAGELLRREVTFLPRKVALAELEAYPPRGQAGGIFMDAPKVSTTAELVAAAKDTAEWRKLVEAIHMPSRAKKQKYVSK